MSVLDLGGYNGVIQFRPEFIRRCLTASNALHTFHSRVVTYDAFLATIADIRGNAIIDQLRRATHIEQVALILYSEIVNVDVLDHRIRIRLVGDLVANNADATLAPATEAGFIQSQRKTAPQAGANRNAANPQQIAASIVGGMNPWSPIVALSSNPSATEIALPQAEVRSLGGIVAAVEISVSASLLAFADPRTASVQLAFQASDLQIDRVFANGLEHLVEMSGGAAAGALLGRRPAHETVPLGPRISLVGSPEDRATPESGPVTAGPNQFEALACQAFGVRDSYSGAQGFAIGIAVTSGALPSSNDVTYFLTGADFGLRYDTVLLTRILKHKWQAGCFVREFVARSPVMARSRDTAPQPAELINAFKLDVLERVTIEYDDGLRESVLVVRGTGTATPQGLQIRYGVFIPADRLNREDFDISPRSGIPWAFGVHFDHGAALEGPAMRALWWDGVNPLLRPFDSSLRGSSGASRTIVSSWAFSSTEGIMEVRGVAPRAFH